MLIFNIVLLHNFWFDFFRHQLNQQFDCPKFDHIAVELEKFCFSIWKLTKGFLIHSSCKCPSTAFYMTRRHLNGKYKGSSSSNRNTDCWWIPITTNFSTELRIQRHKSPKLPACFLPRRTDRTVVYITSSIWLKNHRSFCFAWIVDALKFPKCYYYWQIFIGIVIWNCPELLVWLFPLRFSLTAFHV